MDTTYHGVFDAEGAPQAFYASDIHEDVPAEAVEISWAQWQALLSGQPLSRYVDGEVRMIDPPPVVETRPAEEGPTLEERFAALEARIAELEAVG